MCGCSRRTAGRRAGALLLAAALIPALLTGCGKPEEKPGTLDPLMENQLKTEPLSYFCFNPIEVEEYTVKLENFTEEGNVIDSDKIAVNHKSVRIEGLKNEAVQKKINKTIQDTCKELAERDVAPYRGVKKAIGSWPLKMDEITVYAGANFNNILSIYFQRCMSFEDPEETNTDDWTYHEMISILDQCCLNLDLNTGEQFSLKDVFADGFDYLEFLNNRVAEAAALSFAEDEVYSPSGSLKLAAPFTGLKEDQKFYIQSGGQLVLVLDYDTPEFVLEWYNPNTVPVFYDDCQGNMVLPQRFWSRDSDLFVSKEEPVYFFPISDQSIDVLISDTGEDADGLLSYGRYFSCDVKTPEVLRDVLLKGSEMDPQRLRKLKEECLAAGSPGDGANAGYYSLYGYADVIDRYCSLANDEYCYVYRTDATSQCVQYACYDLYSMRRLGLSDIFKDGFDYREILTAAYLKQLEEAEVENAGESQPITGMSKEELKAYLLDHSEDWEQNFQIDTGGVNVMFFSESDSGVRSTYLSFEDIGCSNLKLFE